MNCTHAAKVLDAYLDGELDAATDAQLAGHLRSCPECASVHDAHRALRAAFADLPRHRASDALRRSVTRELAALERAALSARPRILSWSQAAVLAGAAASLAFASASWLARPQPLPSDDRQVAIARHVAALEAPAEGETRLGIASSDRHVVKPWFAGKIDFAPPVRDLSEHGYVLVGGRTDARLGQLGAVLVYRIRGHQITLSVTRVAAAREQVPTASTLHGFAVVSWASAGLGFATVSDIEPRELQQFAELIRAPAR